MLDESNQVSLINYAIIDNDPLGRSSDLSQFEKDIIIKFLNTLTVEELVNFYPEDLKQQALNHTNYNSIKNDTWEVNEESVEINILSSNFFYDSVKISIEQEEGTIHLALKMSLDPENKKLSRERDALKSVPNLVSPQLFAYRNDESVGLEFLLTSWEHSQNFATLGINDLEYNFGTLAAVLDTVHESDKSNSISFAQNFAENESILESSVSSDEVEERERLMFQKFTDLTREDLVAIYAEIKNNHLPQYKEDIAVLSHANLQKSNILYQSEYIKLINFEHSHVCDIYYSLLKVVNNLSLYKNITSIKRFLTKYHHHSNLLNGISLPQFLAKYEEKRELNKILLFQEILSKILFHFAAYGAFFKKEKLEHYMNLYINMKPTLEKVFPQYMASFDKLFFTCMPTVKTYDIEELKAIAEMYE